LLNESAKCEKWVGIFAGRDDGGARGEATAILFQRDSFYCVHTRTFWLSDTPDVPGSKSASWHNPIPRICTEAVLLDTREGRPSKGERVKIINTHLDYDSMESRRRSLALIMHEVPGDMHAVLCGDLNATHLETETLKLVRRQMVDVLALDPDTAKASTFHGWEGVNQHIDYIFATPGVEASGVVIDRDKYGTGRRGSIGGGAGGGPSTGPVYPSDHFPVFAALTWKSPATGELAPPLPTAVIPAAAGTARRGSATGSGAATGGSAAAGPAAGSGKK